MNQRTAKLLHSYALYSDTKVDELKRWWKSLSWLEKTRERKRMQAELFEEETEDTGEEVIAEEETEEEE